MPIAYNTLQKQDDILSANRHQWFIPEVPGVNSEALRILNTRITFPAFAIGHVQVKLLGHSVGFAGAQEFENTINATFYENVRGVTSRSLLAWLNRCRNARDTTKLTKREYAATSSDLVIYDTVGQPALSFEVKNVFPLNIQLFEIEDDTHGAEVQVSFNADAFVLKQTGQSMTPAQAQSAMTTAGLI